MAVQSTSNVRTDLPLTNASTSTSDMRAVFATIKTELELVFGAINAGTSTAPNLTSIGNLSTFGTIELTGSGVAAVYTVSSFAKTLLDDTTAAAMRTTLGLGTAATSDTSAFAAAGHSHTAATLPAMAGATSGAAGAAGLVPAPQAGDNVKYLTGAGSFTGLAGTQSGDITATSGFKVINPELKAPSETYFDAGTSGTSKTLSFANGTWQTLTLNQNSVTLAFSNYPTSGKTGYMVLFVKQDATGNRKVTNWGGIKWPGGTAPVLTATASGVDCVGVVTFDGGTNLYGFPSGLAFA